MTLEIFRIFFYKATEVKKDKYFEKHFWMVGVERLKKL